MTILLLKHAVCEVQGFVLRYIEVSTRNARKTFENSTLFELKNALKIAHFLDKYPFIFLLGLKSTVR